MKSNDPPPAPDPVATANAQAKSNKDTAIATYGLNATNQTTPVGKLTYNQIGQWADGTPRFEAVTSLSPEEQSNLNQQHEYDSLVNTLGINQTKKVTGILDTPMKLGNEATESRLFDLGRKRLDPMFAQRRSALETDLYNKGVMPGTEAYDRAMMEDTRGSNDAYNELLLHGRGQANTELLAERNQPLNEITALMAGGQVTMPNFVGTPQSNVANTDVAGITQAGYQNSLEKWKSENATRNALIGAIGGAGGTALGGWASGGFKGFK